MVSKRGLLACLIVIFISNSALLAGDDGWVIRQITNSGYINPSSGIDGPDMAVSGKNVIWLELHKRLMFSNGDVTKQITDGKNYVYFPLISGNNVVWEQQTDNGYQIMFWDGTATKQISDGDNDHNLSGISGDKVVWLDEIEGDYYNYQVMLWDGHSVRQISNGEGSCGGAQISGANVVWSQDINGVSEIMFWDGTIARQIAIAEYFLGPQISGKNVVWGEYGQDGYRIMFWDGQTARQISDANIPYYDGQGPHISGNKIVWLSEDYGLSYEISQVMFWDGGAVKQLTSNLKRKSCLSISRGNVIWVENPVVSQQNVISLIYYWDGRTAAKLTEVEGWCVPYLSGANVVYKAYDEDYDYQIFSAYRHGGGDPRLDK